MRSPRKPIHLGDHIAKGSTLILGLKKPQSSRTGPLDAFHTTELPRIPSGNEQASAIRGKIQRIDLRKRALNRPRNRKTPGRLIPNRILRLFSIRLCSLRYHTQASLGRDQRLQTARLDPTCRDTPESDRIDRSVWTLRTKKLRTDRKSPPKSR